MLYDLSVWLEGLILLSPILAFGLAWARINRYYTSRQVQQWQKLFYVAALVAGSVSTLAYLGYWSWWVCQMYHATLPFVALLTLERLIHVSRVVSLFAIACLVFGRGPYRIPLVLTTLWVTLQLWMHGDVIHWA